MTETTRAGILGCFWFITTAGILCWFLTGSVPVIAVVTYAVCNIAGAGYLWAR